MDKYSSNTRFPSGLRKKVTERNSRITNLDILEGNRNKQLDAEFRQRFTDPEGTGSKFNLFSGSGKYPKSNQTHRGPREFFPKNFGLNIFKPKTRDI